MNETILSCQVLRSACKDVTQEDGVRSEVSSLSMDERVAIAIIANDAGKKTLSNFSYFQYLAKIVHQKTHCGALFFSTRTGCYQGNFSLPCGPAPQWLGWGPTRCPGPDRVFLLLYRQQPKKVQEALCAV